MYYNLLTAGTLGGRLADIEEQAQELFLRLVEQYADTEGVMEALKADDPMAWVRKMNSIRNRANEAVMQEIVYGYEQAGAYNLRLFLCRKFYMQKKNNAVLKRHCSKLY